MTSALHHPAFREHTPEFRDVLGDAPRLSRLLEVDAHEGPVYVADENALYFTTLPRPGVDGAPSVEDLEDLFRRMKPDFDPTLDDMRAAWEANAALAR
jgi:hypothetical protein